MSAPTLARLDDDGDRFYPWKGETFWSVTTIIDGGVPKYGLPRWYAKGAAGLVLDDILGRGPHARAHAAVRRWSRLGRAEVIARQAAGELTSVRLDKLTDYDLASRWLKGAPERTRDEASALGIEVHDEAEDEVLRIVRESGEALVEGAALPDWPDHLTGFQYAFRNFLADWRPIYRATEATVFNRPQAYAGTLDAAIEVEIAPEVVIHPIVDYKSGANVWPTVGMQLAAYSRAEFMAAPDLTEVPLPQIDAGAVLHLRPPTRQNPRGYRFRLVRIDERVFNGFLFAREVYRFNKVDGRSVIAAPLVPWRAAA